MLKIITGDTATFTFSITYPGAVDGLAAPDLSEATVLFAMQKTGTNRLAIEKTSVHPETNIVYFELSATDTAALVAGVYNACCKVIFDNGVVKTAWLGDITVIKGLANAR